jgi:biopolymer transport protein ExbD
MAQAAADGDDGTAPAITGINVTPLVDVTLVLLIVFMVTAKVIVSQAIPMQIPGATTPAAVQITIAVGIAADGALTLDGKPMPDSATLARAAKTRAGEDVAGAHVVIAASRASTHGAVIGAVDALRSVGITKIAFAVEKLPKTE